MDAANATWRTLCNRSKFRSEECESKDRQKHEQVGEDLDGHEQPFADPLTSLRDVIDQRMPSLPELVQFLLNLTFPGRANCFLHPDDTNAMNLPAVETPEAAPIPVGAL